MGEIVGVVFDVGGVLCPSPFPALGVLSSKFGLSRSFFSEVIRGGKGKGAWELLEMGKISIPEFDVQFAHECKLHFIKLKEKNGESLPSPLPEFSGKIFLDQIAKSTYYPRQKMMDLLVELKKKNYKIGVITNNWKIDNETTLLGPLETKKKENGKGNGERSLREVIGECADVVIESSAVGIRKPAPEIFHLCLEQLKLPSEKVVFLDDIGANLRSAKKVGMKTILVSTPRHPTEKEEERVLHSTFQQLEDVLKIQLDVLSSFSSSDHKISSKL
eukprot:CAMPEP_0201504792 /NCGR_PEP_ID=MMETSP0151_2-20130828/85408_1 /ASSEMBLY_ACC=CAM_ASM_000257 /TAXON_ID=200890 /ORGANISM="Paramoeba atlantica, Strain 621/1 / CCAP 1560/9" /LENGTH=273 /DNA_ID=CAMNT_0047898583 /DNA_START=42 /DNA_END=863 /DNA_ORIENTATION=-